MTPCLVGRFLRRISAALWLTGRQQGVLVLERECRCAVLPLSTWSVYWVPRDRTFQEVPSRLTRPSDGSPASETVDSLATTLHGLQRGLCAAVPSAGENVALVCVTRHTLLSPTVGFTRWVRAYDPVSPLQASHPVT